MLLLNKSELESISHLLGSLCNWELGRVAWSLGLLSIVVVLYYRIIFVSWLVPFIDIRAPIQVPWP